MTKCADEEPCGKHTNQHNGSYELCEFIAIVV